MKTLDDYGDDYVNDPMDFLEDYWKRTQNGHHDGCTWTEVGMKEALVRSGYVWNSTTRFRTQIHKLLWGFEGY